MTRTTVTAAPGSMIGCWSAQPTTQMGIIGFRAGSVEGRAAADGGRHPQTPHPLFWVLTA
jgi:hypothetical protein